MSLEDLESPMKRRKLGEIEGRVMDYYHRISIVPPRTGSGSVYAGGLKHTGKILFINVGTTFAVKVKEVEKAVYHKMDSEVFQTHFRSEVFGWTVTSVRYVIHKRLLDYGMGDDAIQSISEEILHLAQEKKDEVDYVLPVCLKISVSTVKQESESLEECKERAMRASNLVPLRFCTYVIMNPSVPRSYARHLLSEMNNHKFNLSMDENVNGSVYCRWCSKYTKLADYVSMGGPPYCSHKRGKFRVEDPGQCHVCSKDIKLGQDISAVPTCLHLFHTICILRWMDEHTLVCPKCITPAYDPPKNCY